MPAILATLCPNHQDSYYNEQGYSFKSGAYAESADLCDNKADMDFLDPRLKRTRNLRLFVGYMLISLVIGLSTVILIFGAYGYGINTKTGQIVQNGLLFVKSQPSGGQVFLNGRDAKSATTSRLVLPAGDYTLAVKRDGYNDWQRKFTLDDHSIARFDYPILFPTKPIVSSVKTYLSRPGFITQSPDKSWLILENPDGSFEVYDTNDLTKEPVSERVPAALLTDSGRSVIYHVEQWSLDNVHLLLRHDFVGGSEFILFNRDNPTDSINLNRTFKTNPSNVFMRNQKIDQLYLYDRASGTIRLGDVKGASLAAPMLSHVLAFKSYGTNLAGYVTDKGTAAGQVEARIWNSGKTYKLYDLKASGTYFLDATQYSGHWYYLAGSGADARIEIFKDPLGALQASSSGKAVPLVALNQPGAQTASFSPGGQFVEAENGGAFSVMDLQRLRAYNYYLPNNLAGQLRWLDIAHLTGLVDGKLFVMDYDSANQQSVTASVAAEGGYLSRDLHHMLTINSNPSGSFDLLNVDMRAGADLPKQP